jgi:PAS domain S-box-containing protein
VANEPRDVRRMFEALLEVVPDAIVCANSNGLVISINQQAETLFGYTRDELLGSPVEELMSAATGVGAESTLFGRRKDGSEFPAEISLSSVQTPAGRVAITAVRDITERMAGRRMFEQLLEAAPDAIVGVDADGSIMLVNQQAERIFGYLRSELLGEPVERLVPKRYQGAHARHRSGYLGTRPMGAELPLFGLRKDGTEFPAEISLSNIETASGRIAIAAVRDITERLTAESLVKKEVHRRATIAAMLRGEEAERARIATALHDDTIQVMTASLISIDRICTGLDHDSDLRARLEVARAAIAEATERARRLTFELRPAVLHEQGLTPAITALADHAGREIDAAVQVSLPSGRFEWSVEEVVYRTVQEAIANLRKHSQAKNVSVIITRRGNVLAGIITDDGRGFSTEEPATRPDHVLHIGLDTMVERVRLSGGELLVDTSPGAGTRISFEVPLNNDNTMATTEAAPKGTSPFANFHPLPPVDRLARRAI